MRKEFNKGRSFGLEVIKLVYLSVVCNALINFVMTFIISMILLKFSI